MSKFLEYLKLIPAGVKNLDKVVEGIINNAKLEKGTLSSEAEAEIYRRRAICDGCPYLSTNATAAGWYAADRTDEHCTMCGCPKSFRTASLDMDCGIEAFNKQHPEQTMPLKWTKFNENE